jgi:hypothetical protein
MGGRGAGLAAALICAGALCLAPSAAAATAAENAAALCRADESAWRAELGARGAGAWRSEYGSVRRCTGVRNADVAGLDSDGLDQVVAFRRQVVAYCGEAYRGDPSGFVDRFKAAGETAFGACVQARAAELTRLPKPTAADTRRAAGLCRRERALWGREGRRADWQRARGSVAACARAEATLVVALRDSAGSGPALARALDGVIRLRRDALETCLARGADPPETCTAEFERDAAELGTPPAPADLAAAARWCRAETELVGAAPLSCAPARAPQVAAFRASATIECAGRAACVTRRVRRDIRLQLGIVERFASECAASAPVGAERARCVADHMAAVARQPAATGADRELAAGWCTDLRRMWSGSFGARGAAMWQAEFGSQQRCIAARALLVAQLRQAMCGAEPGSQAACARRMPGAVGDRVAVESAAAQSCASSNAADGDAFVRRFGRLETGDPAFGACVAAFVAGAHDVQSDDQRRVSPAVAALAVLAAWLVACLLLLRTGAPMARRWLLHAAVSLPLATACVVVLAGELAGNPGIYEVDALIKRIALPLTGLALLAVGVLVTRRRGTPPLRRVPDILVAMLVPLTAIALGIGAARGNDLSSVVEDLGLAALFVCGYAVGRLPALRPAGVGPLIGALAVLGLVATLSQAVITPLYGFAVPVAFAAVAAVLVRALPWPWLVVAAVTLGAFLYDGSEAGGLGSALLQVGAGAALVAFWFGTRERPRLAWGCVALAVAGAAAVLAVTDARTVATGDYRGSDVSLAQRSFEARAVRDLLDSDPLTLAAGGGLGASVDLTGAPDVRTLETVRDDLRAVNDVHLLPWDLMRRYGVLGLAWLAGLLGLLALLAWRARSATDPRTLLLALLALVGLVNALPAASHLFANPLMGVALGGLVGALLPAAAGAAVERVPAGRTRRVLASPLRPTRGESMAEPVPAGRRFDARK